MNKMITTPTAGPMPSNLEDLLDWLQQFGRPFLHCGGHGWNCSIEMRVSSVGAEFKVASEYRHERPLAAAKQCAERVTQTLRDLGAA